MVLHGYPWQVRQINGIGGGEVVGVQIMGHHGRWISRIFPGARRSPPESGAWRCSSGPPMCWLMNARPLRVRQTVTLSSPPTARTDGCSVGSLTRAHRPGAAQEKRAAVKHPDDRVVAADVNIPP